MSEHRCEGMPSGLYIGDCHQEGYRGLWHKNGHGEGIDSNLTNIKFCPFCGEELDGQSEGG